MSDVDICPKSYTFCALVDGIVNALISLTADNPCVTKLAYGVTY